MSQSESSSPPYSSPTSRNEKKSIVIIYSKQKLKIEYPNMDMFNCKRITNG